MLSDNCRIITSIKHMSHFSPEQSILHVISKAQIRLLQYKRTLGQLLSNEVTKIESEQSGIYISPLPIPIPEYYEPFKWRLFDEIGFYPLKGDNDSSLILGFEVLWNEGLWAIKPYVEIQNTNNIYCEPLREPLCDFTRFETDNLANLRTLADKALDELIQRQIVRDQLLSSEVSYKEIKEILWEPQWNEEPRKSLFN